jgi:pilus assembly protein FimV
MQWQLNRLAAFCSLWMTSQAMALELGTPEVLSGLGQPLLVRAPISGPESAAPLASTVECAAPECADVRLRSRIAGRSSGQLAVEVISLDPVSLPSFSLRVVVKVADATASRELTVLLSPPLHRQTRLVLEQTAPEEPAPRRRSLPRNRPAALPQATATARLPGSDSWVVAPGENLSSIARRLARERSGTAKAWMEALLRDNPEAFIGGNPDRIKAGARLAVGPAPTVAAAPDEASAPGPVPPPAIMPTAPDSATTPATTAEVLAGAKSEARALTEENTALMARMAALESRIARLQVELETAPVALPVVPSATPEPVSASVAATPAGDAPDATPIAARTEAVPAEPAGGLGVPVTPPVASVSPADAATTVSAAVSQPGPVEPARPAVTPPSEPAAAVATLQAFDEAGIPAWSLAVGGVVALSALLLIGLHSRRKRPNELRASTAKPHDESIKTAIRERLQSELQEGAGTLDELKPPAVALAAALAKAAPASGTDVVSEVDVNIVYGMFAEAETLLQGALAQAPNNPELLVKLAEVYFYQRNTQGLVHVAERILTQPGDLPPWLWTKVHRLGRELCPDQAIFGEGGKVVEFPGRTAARRH